MRLRQGPEAPVEITTSSMADIAFLLIVFFMVTAVFSATKGLAMESPDPDVDAPIDPTPAVLIKVIDEHTLMLDGKPASLEQILPYLEPKLLNWPEKPVVLHTLADAPYSAMVRVYDELMKVNLPREEGGLGISTPVNVSLPSHREIRAYEELFQIKF